MSDEDIPMAQCGACDSIIPLDSESCPNCGVHFGGITEEELGECGACQSIIPADSTSCPNCGAVFVEQETVTEETVVVPEQVAANIDEIPEADEIEELPETSAAQIDDIHEDPHAPEENQADVESTEDEESIELQEDIEEQEEEVSVMADEEPSIESEGAEDTSEDESESVEETDSEEENIQTMMDDLVDDLEDEESEDDVEEEVVEEEKEPEIAIEESEIVMAFENLALAIAAKGMTAAEAFGEMDSSDDHLIDAPELQKGIEKIAGEKLVSKQVTAILNYLDTDGDRRVDPNELVKALEDLRIGIQPGKLPKIKSFPSPLQKFLMGKKANDIVYPIAYFLMVTFIGLWVVNGICLLYTSPSPRD